MSLPVPTDTTPQRRQPRKPAESLLSHYPAGRTASGVGRLCDSGRKWFCLVVGGGGEVKVKSSGLGLMSQDVVACFSRAPTHPHSHDVVGFPPWQNLWWAQCIWTPPRLAQPEAGVPGSPHQDRGYGGKTAPRPDSSPLPRPHPLKIAQRRLSRFTAGIWPLVRFYHIPPPAAVPSRPLAS